MPGGRKPGSIPTYPDDAIQSSILPSDWWVKDSACDHKTGRLVWAFIPHVDQLPYVILPEGRQSPTEHKVFKAVLAPLDIKRPDKRTKQPIAVMPCNVGEYRVVYRAKRRPAIIVAEKGIPVPDKLRAGKPKWQTAPTVLVAPFYGGEQDGKRAGFNPVFMERVRKVRVSAVS